VFVKFMLRRAINLHSPNLELREALKTYRLPIPKPCKPLLLYLVAKSRSSRMPFLHIST
jgi:hypothetical protein